MDIPMNSNLEEYEIEVAESIVIGEVTLDIGDTVTGEAGTDALVENVGDDKNIVLKFTIPRGANGADGDDGVGIASVVLNQDYTLTITLTDGTSYTTASIRGAIGPAGPSGDDGYSPEVTITQITGGHRVTITDETHPSGQSFEVHDGEDGQSGSDGVGIASVSLNQDYTLTITLTNGTSYTTTSIRGATGQQGQSGQDGEDGYSPEVTITTITGGHRVTITDETHPTGQSFDVLDGQSGGGSGSGIPVAEATRSSGAFSVTVDGITALSNGVAVAVKLPSTAWTTATTAVTLNVNSLGGKSVYNLSGHQVTLADLSPNEVHVFVYAVTTSYNGNWLMLDTDLVNEGLTYGTVSGSGTSRTMSATGFKLKKGALVAAKFSSAVGANATLNVNSRGAKPIYYKGSAIVLGIIGSNDTAFMMYDGSYWQVLAVDTAVEQHNTYGTCSTVSNMVYTVTVSTSQPDYIPINLKTGSIVTVAFEIDVAQTNPMLSVGGRTHYIYHKGVALPANTIKSGDTAMFVFDGYNKFHLIAIDTLGGGGSYDDGDSISY